MSATYELSITDSYGYNDVIGFESVYDAEEQLLDSLDRCVGSQGRLRAPRPAQCG
jgi:hypothetical protein